VVEKIMNLFPNCAVAPAHGSLPSKKLENTILSFFNGGVDILVCTTIIESGLDVTNANTVIINNSHRFGLAQLYQIRGRVGRGNLQAYCWLLIPKKTLNKNAYQRLKTIEHFSALGSGYQIALKDLEIRGAGNVFGYEQSGHINRVGYDMYCKLLKEEVEKHVELQKSGKKEYRPVIVFRGPAFFPDSYMPLVQDRVFFYRLLSLAEEINTVNSINDEIIDRFGRMPHEANNVVTIAKIRESFTGLGIKKVSLNNASVVIRFSGDRVHGEFNLNGLQKILAESKRDFRFVQNGDFAASIKTSSYDDAFAFVYYFAELIKTNLL
jgi:transcription-repair coupling factor (superfamily II helicase)